MIVACGALHNAGGAQCLAAKQYNICSREFTLKYGSQKALPQRKLQQSLSRSQQRQLCWYRNTWVIHFTLIHANKGMRGCKIWTKVRGRNRPNTTTHYIFREQKMLHILFWSWDLPFKSPLNWFYWWWKLLEQFSDKIHKVSKPGSKYTQNQSKLILPNWTQRWKTSCTRQSKALSLLMKHSCHTKPSILHKHITIPFQKPAPRWFCKQTFFGYCRVRWSTESRLTLTTSPFGQLHHLHRQHKSRYNSVFYQAFTVESVEFST